MTTSKDKPFEQRCTRLRWAWELGVTISLLACSSGSTIKSTATADDASAADEGSSASPAAKPLGAPCVSEDEQSAMFSGSSAFEVDITEQTPQCASGICLSDHFQGRVTCPYGQSQTDIQSLAPDDAHRCRLTTKDNVVGSQPVTVPVPPQWVSRRPEDVVICSCQCAGPDPQRTYCSCPAGMECSASTGFPVDGGFTTYCVKSGHQFDRRASTATCSAVDGDAGSDCGNGGRNP